MIIPIPRQEPTTGDRRAQPRRVPDRRTPTRPSDLEEFNACHDPKSGEFSFNGTGSCQTTPRRGPGSAGPQVLVGITSARPDRRNIGVISTQMEAFRKQLHALPGVSHARVTLGTGAWEGGGEPTWVVAYRGNGEARRLLARTAKKYHQDAVLVLSGCKSAARCMPMVEWTFDSPLKGKRRDAINETLGEAGFGGWTWLERNGRPVLRAAAVSQWGADRTAHLGMTQRITRAFARSGLTFRKTITNVRTEVMEREGAVTYDDVLRRAY